MESVLCNNVLRIFSIFLLIARLVDGSEIQLPKPSGKGVGFTRLPPEVTGIHFTNQLADIRSVTNRNLLSGSGLALGDVDGDGRCDIYFCALDNSNVLYRNLGNWKFEDATERAGVACANQDSTGAVLVDVDGDGDLDLLVSGLGTGVRLFMNDGKGVFTEQTKEAGLQSTSGAMSMTLADIDGDDDLDLYVVNYRPNTLKDLPDARFQIEYVDNRPVITKFNGRPTTAPDLTNRFTLSANGSVLELGEPDQLYLNDGKGHFKAVSFTGGTFLDEDGKPLAAPPLDWGLAAKFYDFNGDGAPDLYVCNDLFSPDRIWINDGHGRFRAIGRTDVRCTSTFSMGIDFADINRDGSPDFFVTDMLSRSHTRYHTQVGEMSSVISPVGLFENRPQKGQNTLQINRGDSTFGEIAWYAGVEASEWSWGPIFLDVDLDGWEDLIISNGNQYDVQNADVAMEIEKLKSAKKLDHQELLGLLRHYPKLTTRKLAYHNDRNFTFNEIGAQWGFAGEEVSQGMALADLDNDGDLDLLSNNLFVGAGLYRNESTAPRVAVRLKGVGANTAGIGAKITFSGGPVLQSQEMVSGGRYLSGDDAMRVFAAGTHSSGKLEVKWHNGTISTVNDIKPNHLYQIAQADGALPTKSAEPQPWFEDVSDRLNHAHKDEPFEDLLRQPLLPMRLSQLGPGVAWHDFDADGWEDLILPSGRGGKLALFRNDRKGGFTLVNEPVLQRTVARDQTTPLAIGPLLLIGSANYEDGQTNGGWMRILDMTRKASGESLLGPEASTGPMALADVDGDGLLDLFVGGRAIAGKFPLPATSILFKNEGNRFVAKQRFEKLGLVSGAVFSDIDSDGDADLILATQWGPIRIFRNEKGTFTEATEQLGLGGWKGLWNGVATGDFDNDGRPDIIVSNWGLNSRWKATPEHPLKLYYGDLDGNGIIDTIEARFDEEMQKEVPIRILKSVGPALPFVQEKMQSFAAYGKASIQEIYGDTLKRTEVMEVTTLSSMLFLNRGTNFEARPLPAEAQFAPAFGIAVGDLDGDGNEDVLLAQNVFAINPEMPRADAGRGLILQGDGKGNLIPVPGQLSGIKAYGEQRGCALADYDHDGRLDVIIMENGTATKLYHNRGARPGLRVKIEGPPQNPAGIGAQLRIPVRDGTIVREIQAGSGYWSMNGGAQVIHSIEAIRVRLPSSREITMQINPRAKLVRISDDGSATYE